VIDITERVLAQKELEQRVDARSRELQALLAVYRKVVSLDTEPLLDLTLKQLQMVVDYTSAAIMTLDEDELVMQAFRGTSTHQPPPKLRIKLNTIAVAEEIVRSRHPVTIVDIREKSERVANFSRQMEKYFADIYEYTWAWMGVPLIIRGEVIGILNLFHNQPNYYMPYHADLALAFAHHVTVAIESDRHYHQVRELATLTERDRLARSLHDRLAQALGYINIKASLIDHLLTTEQIGSAQDSLRELKTVVTNTYADVREAIFNLRTKVYGGADFLPMLRDYLAEYESQYNIKTRVAIDNEDLAVFPDQVGTQVIRVIQEALSNVRKHASANQVRHHFFRSRRPGLSGNL
jgi:nitrate/nitrite-specific signal transduction histidine kinase